MNHCHRRIQAVAPSLIEHWVYIMKAILTVLAGVLGLSVMLPAFAGPDWAVIEAGRKNHRTQVAQMEKLTPDQKCAAEKLVLPLDHGPRAVSTPYLNAKRKEQFDAEHKACKAAVAEQSEQ